MKSSALALLSLAGLAVAHGDHHRHRRQAPAGVLAASGSSSTSVAATVTTTPAAATSPPAAAGGGYTVTTTISGRPVITTYTVPPQVTFSLFSTNPTAVPLASIVAGAPSQASIPLPTTYPAGATQTFVPSAPGLPDLTKIIPTNYPALDVTPPTDSPEVQAWIQEVQNSGVSIPNITATLPGGCPANPDIVADTSRCWWTCGGCVRDTDVTTCPDPMTWGLTYDDGPSPWTPNLLAYFQEHDLRGTFFSIGSRAISLPNVLQAEFMMGNQIGVHTWSHPDMTTLTNEELIAEFGWARQVIKDIIGVTPNTWRPPYGDVDDRVRAIASAMGLTTIIWSRLSPTSTFDTQDYDIAGDLVSPSEVLGNFSVIAKNATTMSTGFILLEHDLFQQTVDIATGYILPDALAYQPPFTIKTVVECLNMPLSNAYVETNDNSTNPLPQKGAAAPTTFSNSAAYSSASATATGSSGGGKSSTDSSSGALSLRSSGTVVAVVLGAAAAYML